LKTSTLNPVTNIGGGL